MSNSPWVNAVGASAVAAVANGGTGASTAQAAAQNLSVPYDIAKSGIPFIKPATGTMGNNGAFTNGTALSLTYSAGAWCWFTAGQIAAGVPAAGTWYWSVWSSTTAATIYNSTYTTGAPAVGVTTAFATTGPGATAGDTSEVFAQQIVIPAASMGANGYLAEKIQTAHTANANVKTVRFRADGTAGTIYGSWLLTSRATGELDLLLRNRGAQNKNFGQSFGFGDNNAISQVVTPGVVDFSAQTTGVISVQGATATDNVVVEGYTMQAGYGA